MLIKLVKACSFTLFGYDVVPNVNPDTGERNGIQPLKTLMSYRRVDKGAIYKACFGKFRI